jgi:hypothetical protein
MIHKNPSQTSTTNALSYSVLNIKLKQFPSLECLNNGAFGLNRPKIFMMRENQCNVVTKSQIGRNLMLGPFSLKNHHNSEPQCLSSVKRGS